MFSEYNFNYRKGFNSLLSLTDTVALWIRHFQYLGDETAFIYRRLEKAMESTYKIILENDIIPYEQWEQSYMTILAAIKDTALYAKLHSHLENILAVYISLNIIEISADCFINPTWDFRQTTLIVEKMINAVLSIHGAEMLVHCPPLAEIAERDGIEARHLYSKIWEIKNV